MTRKKNSASKQNWKELLMEEDFLQPLVEQILQQVLEAEMDEALQAEKGQRTPKRLGYRSGYYPRKLVTRVGQMELRVPQDRHGRFRTEVFERCQRSEKALVGALAEMYVQGVSTRKVKAITEELCGHEFSASPTGTYSETNTDRRTMTLQSTADGGVTDCLSSWVHSTSYDTSTGGRS